MTKQTAIVVCPGRGTYGQGELGYLKTHHSDKADFMAAMDAARADDVPSVSELDGAEKFRTSLHLPGNNASGLIYACALADFLSIDRDKFDIVGVTGNSLGWYMALACAGAVSLSDGAKIVNTTGALMHERASGGQVVYPITDEDWVADSEKATLIQNALDNGEGEIAISIRLGGMVVFAADDTGCKWLMDNLPGTGVFPMKLPYHGAFHSKAMEPISKAAFDALGQDLFAQPELPLIDGRGAVHNPGGVDLSALYDYTFGHQISRTYDFTRAVEVATREFAPDVFIVLGPGTTLGAPVAQSLIGLGEYGLTGKENFKTRQQDAPVVLSMGLQSQRKYVTK